MNFLGLPTASLTLLLVIEDDASVGCKSRTRRKWLRGRHAIGTSRQSLEVYRQAPRTLVLPTSGSSTSSDRWSVW
jgi:hypothetical protein